MSKKQNPPSDMKVLPDASAAAGEVANDTKKIEVVVILPSLRDALTAYLQTRPFQEVANLIHSLNQSPTSEYTYTERSK